MRGRARGRGGSGGSGGPGAAWAPAQLVMFGVGAKSAPRAVAESAEAHAGPVELPELRARRAPGVGAPLRPLEPLIGPV